MALDRRQFLATAAAAGIVAVASSESSRAARAQPIDRVRVVRRHNPEFARFDPFHALSVGNGDFAFTVDVTGLQTFASECAKDFPLCTAANWGWHTSPKPVDLKGETLRLRRYDAHGRSVPYATDSTGQKQLFDSLRMNEHKFHLGRIAFVFGGDGSPAVTVAELSAVHQRLDLWTGVIESQFVYKGRPVRVFTCAHPAADQVAIRVESPLIAAGLLRVKLSFPYASPDRSMADWSRPEAHQTTVLSQSPQRITLQRTMDTTRYVVDLSHSAGSTCVQSAVHEFVLRGHDEQMEFTCAFSPSESAEASAGFAATQAASAAHWRKFWTGGGMVDLAGSTDNRAEEVERRTILSLYNTAVHCCGSLPPAETGLLCNSWYGKFHLEMHWWHGVHFAAWNRFPMFARSLDYYAQILPAARELAQTQGYRGVRWPKMTDRSGRDSPSPVGPLLIWQQPHPIYYAELAFRSRPGRTTLEHWRAIVFGTADFLADYAFQQAGRAVLGPPLKTVPENTDPLRTCNPTFELAYWRVGLRIAQTWRQRLGMQPEPTWAEMAARLSPLPMVDGLYLLQEGMTDTYTKWNWEHPSQLGALGMLPGDGVDTAVMRASLKRAMEVWRWDTCWGWDFPMAALCAARVGEPELAVDALMIDSPKNHYHPNGHVYQRPDLTAYLPANGGFLAAVGMMAKGWSSCGSRSAPGFPPKRWQVLQEGLNVWL